MSGSDARKGFKYQDNYLLFRVLRAAADCLQIAWESGANDVLQILDNSTLQFGIEASSIEGNGPDWDVLVLDAKKLEFIEVKSGVIGKADRITFWKRLRKEINRSLTDANNITPVLVVDPQKNDNLTKWQGLDGVAAAYSSKPLSEPMGNVLTPEQLLTEALWYMCEPDATDDAIDLPVTIKKSCEVLSRFSTEYHDPDLLTVYVENALELLFPGGLQDIQQKLLLGWLTERATTPNKKRRLFTIRELLIEIKILDASISLLPGELKSWKTLWSELPQNFIARTRIQLGKSGNSFPAAQVQPHAFAALTENNYGLVISLY